jgi:UDP-N-acetylmuramoyl-tripeptide--D-alanyl-D-alanine ligase
VIAITGSNGKTTTKELTASLLRSQGHSTHATPGNWNNRWGIPLTVSRLSATHRRAVIEMGAGDIGDIGGKPVIAHSARRHNSAQVCHTND